MISGDGREFSTNAYYYHYSTARADVSVLKGRWYYEVTMKSVGSARIGWCTDKYKPESEYNGIGADDNSWGFDGYSHKKYHKNNNGETYGESWNAGDVVGVMLDIEQKRVSYSINGIDLGIAFSNIRVDGGLHPVVSIQSSAKVQVNFGRKFKYLPAGYTGMNPTNTESNKISLEKIFNEYASIERAEDDDDVETIKAPGVLKLAMDMGSSGPTDPTILIIAWKLKCSKQWEISKDEWMVLWSLMGVGDIDEIKECVDEWRAEIEDLSLFKSFYAFIFTYLKAPQATVLESTEALMAWRMCGLPEIWPLFDKWELFWKSTSIKGVNKDTWTMLVQFVETVGGDIDKYNETDCWPLAIDEFVEHLKSKSD
eukprot:TRINITY_DN1010_c0_g1_i1.p1 TRINITY_DN1010_c0_g1~~TRINITY_DN1010_c0_g1_i1.p1  ORF type:complete len:369 (-),score=99.42 TRINITY_DN1010_c0_g1_i1:111-1217(-)